MTPDILAAFCLGITVGVWLTCIVGMAIYAIAGRDDVPVVTGAHVFGPDDDDDDELDEDDDADWIIDSVLMQRGRVDSE